MTLVEIKIDRLAPFSRQSTVDSSCRTTSFIQTTDALDGTRRRESVRELLGGILRAGVGPPVQRYADEISNMD
jgi:hypothetical protein